jgi:hypothetical protein
MSVAFKPDLFSTRRPQWIAVSDATAASLDAVVLRLPQPLLPLATVPEQPDSLEVNSKNFRLSCAGGRVLLKRWPVTADPSQAQRTLELMVWLANQGMAVPRPMQFREGGLLHVTGDGQWCAFPFVEGDYFSGSGTEVDEAATKTGELARNLARLAPEHLPVRGPEHLTDKDDRLLGEMERQRHEWPALFGVDHSQVLSGAWEQLRALWRRLRSERPDGGPVQAAHFDLHPHNWLMKNERVTAILDFESCKQMPIGYAVAFAGLKQGRQAVVASGEDGSARSIGTRFQRAVCQAYAPLTSVAPHFADLALAEVLRRLCVIFRLNIEQGDRAWNRVLPVQLGHLDECGALFR